MVAGDVTVVIPTRNRLAMLRQALASVLAQVAPAVRVVVVVVDEGSSDGTTEWLEGLGDPRVSFLRHDMPKGLPAARNTGLAQTATRWVAFCDDDDLWAPNKLGLQLRALSEVPGARWSATGTVSVDAELQIVGHQRTPPPGDISAAVRIHNVVPAGGSSVVVERALGDEAGWFDDSLTSCEDYDLWCRLAERSPIAPVDRPLIAYRVLVGNMSSDVGRMRRMLDEVQRRHRIGVPASAVREGDLIAAQYLARFPLREGRRLAAAAAYADIAWRFRLPKHLLHAAAAAVVPRQAEQLRRREERSRIPEEWRDEAASWLAAFRVAGDGQPARAG